MPKGVVGNWLEQRFLDWQSGTKRKQTVTAFAAHLEVSRDTLNKWMNGARIPSGPSLDLIAAKLGHEIYDLAGVPRPDPLLQLIVRNWGAIPDEVKQEIAATVERAEARGIVGAGDKRVEVPKPKRKTRS